MCLSGPMGTCYNGTSDSSGNYTVGPMPAGKYIVTVSAGSLDVVDATYDSAYNVVTGRETNDVGLPEPLEFPSSVTVTGTTLGSEHFLEADDPTTILFRPHFPSEPAGTEIAYLITSAVSSLYDRVTASEEVLSEAGVTYISGAIVLIVSYGAGGTPTVIGQYPDTSSSSTPTVMLSTTSPGSSRSDSASSGILDQYLSTGEIQSVIPPIPHVLWTQISNRPSYYIVSRSKASVDVRAVGPHIVIGAIPPPLNSGSATDLACSACGDEYFDPSGTVESTKGIPLKSAKVTLLRSKSAKGPFAAVPNGSSVMSSQNRKDPFQTNALGAFGWDTVPGFYRVTASHAGCTAVPHGKVAETRVVPRPAAGRRHRDQAQVPPPEALSLPSQAEDHEREAGNVHRHGQGDRPRLSYRKRHLQGPRAACRASAEREASGADRAPARPRICHGELFWGRPQCAEPREGALPLTLDRDRSAAGRWPSGSMTPASGRPNW